MHCETPLKICLKYLVTCAENCEEIYTCATFEVLFGSFLTPVSVFCKSKGLLKVQKLPQLILGQFM